MAHLAKNRLDTPGALDLSRAAEKQQALLARLAALDSLLVALSGGADSAYLSWSAHRALGERALSITALSASFSAHDRRQVESFVRHAGVRHEFIQTEELENPLYVANNSDRCYFCKAELFTVLGRLAQRRGFAALAYGINADDTLDFRPGHRAASEHKVLAPLLEAEMSKAEIRELSRVAGLPTWDRPASACLASRIPYGTSVTRETLAQVEAGEAVLRELGFLQFRVRYYGAHARVEIDRAELARAFQPDILRAMEERLARVGFSSVTVDPDGYRQGSLTQELLSHNSSLQIED
ncbi:MAG: ATP-dependent sacrificial sulfur transferase LarE [Acidobacteria bacterium]|nr:ATP-dependent sacrificial sulfur transferase LarE [Acidobacteriota bacterium]MCL5289339.1 ATP-dependent sacrificial sulfur transferase LarE [Acidobacteriota bacterium]